MPRSTISRTGLTFGFQLTIDTVFVSSRDDCWVKYPKTLCFENQCLENVPARGPQACLAHNYSNPVFVSTTYSQCIAMSTNERQTNKISGECCEKLALVAQHCPTATAVTHWRHFRLTEEEELNEEAGFYLELQAGCTLGRYLQLLPGWCYTGSLVVPYQTQSRAGGASKPHQPISPA